MITEDSRSQLAGLAPSPELSVVAIEPPGSEPGTWAGAPSAVRDGDQIVLAYRLRRPIGHGRGYAVAIARSADGVHFETIQVITRDEMDTESLERPALVRTPAGAWRLYLSCATWGTKHWRVELLEAPAPDAFDPGQRVVVLPGDATTAVKDPVILPRGGYVAPVGIGASARRPGQHRPDDHGLRDEPGWRRVDLARPRADAAARRVGLARRSGQRGAFRGRARSWPTTTAGPARRRTTRSGPAWPSASRRVP